MEKFDESILCCNSILNDYPNNGDVLFDKSCNLVMLSKIDEALNLLEHAISQGIQYKVKAKKSKSFEKLLDNPRFQKISILIITNVEFLNILQYSHFVKF